MRQQESGVGCGCPLHAKNGSLFLPDQSCAASCPRSFYSECFCGVRVNLIGQVIFKRPLLAILYPPRAGQAGPSVSRPSQGKGHTHAVLFQTQSQGDIFGAVIESAKSTCATGLPPFIYQEITKREKRGANERHQIRRKKVSCVVISLPRHAATFVMQLLNTRVCVALLRSACRSGRSCAKASKPCVRCAWGIDHMIFFGTDHVRQPFIFLSLGFVDMIHEATTNPHYPRSLTPTAVQ